MQENNNNNSSTGQIFTNSNLSQQEKNLIIRSQCDPVVKRNTDLIKQENMNRSKVDIESTDRKCQHIMTIAERFEELYQSWGFPFMITDICSHVYHLFVNIGLEKDTPYIFQTLPDHYKNKKMDPYKNAEARIHYSRIKRLLAEVESIDLSKLDDSSIREIRKQQINMVDKSQFELESRHVPVEEEQYNQFEELKASEDNNFAKSEISRPLSTPEQLCADPEYENAFQNVRKEFDIFVTTAEKMRNLFTVEYPPLSVASCHKLENGIGNLNKWLQPYADEKYRSDHIQSVRVSFTKAVETSTKASKDSRIACAYTLDKNGLPVMRGLTKEQIDSIYVSEVNFYIKMLNTYFHMFIDISDIFKEHKARSLADRAVSLSPHLSHTA